VLRAVTAVTAATADTSLFGPSAEPFTCLIRAASNSLTRSGTLQMGKVPTGSMHHGVATEHYRGAELIQDVPDRGGVVTQVTKRLDAHAGQPWRNRDESA
jgi:hypothetical protein